MEFCDYVYSDEEEMSYQELVAGLEKHAVYRA